MLICLVTPKFGVSEGYGGEASVSLIADELTKRGISVKVLAAETEGFDPRVNRVAMSTDSLASAMKGADLVHVYNMNSMIPARKAANRRKLPKVITVNSYWATCLFGDMNFPNGDVCRGCSISGIRRDFKTRNPLTVGRRVPSLVGRSVVGYRTREMAKYDKIIVLSKASLRQLVGAGVPNASVDLIPNMADPRTFQIDIGELVDEPNVLFVGALKHTKGPHILLRSLVDVRQQVPGVQATLVGDGPEAEALKKEASALGISNSVSFAGRLHPAELPRLYRKARVLAFPILWEEPFPRVLLEAWAYGTPVVTTTRGAPGELVRDKASGLLVRPGDSKDLARSLALVLEDKSLAERLRRGGREDLRSFLPDVVVPRIIKLYEDLARAGGRAGDGKERWTGIKPGPSTRTI